MRYGYRNIHTHRKAHDALVRKSQVYSLSLGEMEAGPLLLDYDGPISVGLHPWDVDSSWPEKIAGIERWMDDERVVFIGECGLDRIRYNDCQMDAFRAQIELSEKYSLPVMLHVVRMFDEIFGLRRKLRPEQDWILHGFRGKPQQMRQILSQGIDISFGIGMNVLSYRECPSDRRYLETDELDDISEVERLAGC